jgi:serine/threonine-protein kinase
VNSNLFEAGQPRQFTPPVVGEGIAVDGHTYYIGNKIGQGSFGAVYECFDEWSNSLVAKVIIPQGRSFEHVKSMWLEERYKLVNLRHPNITYVHNAFEYRETFYLIIERCSFTLEQIIGGPYVDYGLWIPHIARDVLQAVTYMHSQGYVHKDIHPGNVFVSQTIDRMVPIKDPVWSFKVGDLGISRFESDINIFGTTLAQWMLPPEAIDPIQFGPVSRQTDIYHVGLLLLAVMLNRIPCFSRDDVLAGLPRQIAETHQSSYGPVISRALRRHTAQRTQGALQFWREVQGVLLV